MKKRCKSILIEKKKKNRFLVCVILSSIALGSLVGCSRTEPTPTEISSSTTIESTETNESEDEPMSTIAETQPEDTSVSDITEAVEESLSEEVENIKDIMTAFSEAYFTGDKEALQNYLINPYEWDIEVYEGDSDTVSNITLKGLDTIKEEDIENGCVVSVEFKSSVESDYFQYVTIELVKESEDWKVQFYGREN